MSISASAISLLGPPLTRQTPAGPTKMPSLGALIFIGASFSFGITTEENMLGIAQAFALLEQIQRLRDLGVDR